MRMSACEGNATVVVRFLVACVFVGSCVFVPAYASQRSLKKVLIAGDSTTGKEMGYSGFTISMVSEVADASWAYVGKVPEPCSAECWNTMRYLLQDSIFSRIVAIDPDLLHFNQGHHSITWIDSLSAEQMAARMKRFTEGLTAFFARLRKELPGCTIVYATSLPTDSCAQPRVDPRLGCRRRIENVVAINEAALEVCREMNVMADDLYAFATDNGLERLPDGIHYPLAANRMIGQHAADCIVNALNSAPIRYHKKHREEAEHDERISVWIGNVHEYGVAIPTGLRPVRSVDLYDMRGRRIGQGAADTRGRIEMADAARTPGHSIACLCTEDDRAYASSTPAHR